MVHKKDCSVPCQHERIGSRLGYLPPPMMID